jgi:rhamnosyltransferase
MLLDMVLVTYNPDIKLLVDVIESIGKQVRTVYIIDNSPIPSKALLDMSHDNVQIQPLYENKGIAYAQNVGIKLALENKADFILLSDQDTLYPNDFVKDMFDGSNGDFAAMSPLFHDINQGNTNEGFIIKSLLGFKHIYPESGLHNIFQAIASGCILNTKCLEEIGLMDEDLFIDWVDLEWCWRAIGHGYSIIGNANVTITHQLGDEAVNIGFRDVNLRSPVRHYYITRNAFHLALRCKHLGLSHQIILFLKSFRYVVAFPLLSKPHLTHLRHVVRGFIDGIFGNLGKFKE